MNATKTVTHRWAYSIRFKEVQVPGFGTVLGTVVGTITIASLCQAAKTSERENDSTWLTQLFKVHM